MLINNLNFPWIIIWNNKDNYFIHPYLTKLIKIVGKWHPIIIILYI